MVQRAGQLFIDDLVDQGRLARAGHAGDAGERPKGDGNVDVLQVVFPAAEDLERLAAARAAHRRDGNLPLAGQILARVGPGLRHQILDGALGHDLAAVDACTGADVHDVVRRAHGVLVVLDHDEGVAQIAQPLERVKQLVVVALVQADGGLVENIEHAHQA